jgi:hypothetical protein
MISEFELCSPELFFIHIQLQCIFIRNTGFARNIEHFLL